MTWTLAGRYRLTSSVASGPTGELWRAVDNGTGHPVAVKLLHPYLAADGRVVDQLLGARRSLAELWHPGIARLIDVVLDGDRGAQPVVGLVADLVPGTDLARLLAAGGPLPPARAATVAAAVADALQAAHRAGVVHGDLKPANIMVAAHGGEAVRVTDFSVATLVRVGRPGPELSESSPYTPPWEIDGGMPTFSGDVHALGIVLHEIVTGDPVPEAAAPLDPRLRELVDACMDGRHAAVPPAGEVAERLRELAPHLPRSGAYRRPPPPRGGGTRARHSQPDEGLPTGPAGRLADQRSRPESRQRARQRAQRRADSPADRRAGHRAGLPEDADPASGRRRAPVVLAALALVLVAAVAVVTFGLLNRSEPGTPQVDRSATVAANDAAPALPELATENTQEGGTAFVDYWYAALSHAIRTGDTTALSEATSPDCQQCQSAIGAIEAAHAGGSMRGGGFLVRNVTIAAFWSPERPVYDVTLDRSARTSVDGSGATVDTLPAISFTTCSMVLEWASDRWQIREMITPGCVA